MPWTFAHPAVVLPLRRFCPLRLSFSALIVGSLAPDLGYYINSFGIATFSHTFLGSVLVCLPTGLGMLILFYVFRRPIWFVLPQPHRGLLAPLTTSPAPRRAASVLTAAASVLLGAWTHIVWDSFTHAGGWAVTRFTFLQEPAFRVGTAEFPVYYLLQQLSTLAGVVALGTVYYLWLRRRSTGPVRWFLRDDRWRYTLLLAVSFVALAIALPLAAEAAARVQDYLVIRTFLFRTAVYATAVFIPLLTLCSVFCYVARRED
jgi:hypothetical protein